MLIKIPLKTTQSQSLCRPRQAGETLIEVLVALMILVFSLLGAAAVQYRLAQYAQSAIARSQSSNVIVDIVEKMRANRSAAINTQSYNTGFSSAAADCVATNLRTRYASATGLSGAATAADLASAEVAQLKRELACILPLGDIRIVVGQVASIAANNCTPALGSADEDVVTLIVRYDDRKAEPTNSTSPTAGTSVAVPKCFVEVVQL